MLTTLTTPDHTDAVERDVANLTPRAEVQLLKDSGLVTLLGPAEYGGGGQGWKTTYKVSRTVARDDGSIGALLGYHYLRAWAARLVAADEQIAAVDQLYTEENLLFEGAVNPRDADLTVTEQGDELIFHGHKSFSTGGVVSDLTVLEAILNATQTHIFAIIPTKQDGIVSASDWMKRPRFPAAPMRVAALG